MINSDNHRVLPDNIFVRLHITPTVQREFVSLIICGGTCRTPGSGKVDPLCAIHQAHAGGTTDTMETNDFYKIPKGVLWLHHAALSGGWVRFATSVCY